jgi:AcrR family transcriptional regulator
MATPAVTRQLRCDARRNRERVIEAAREALAEYGLDAQMDDIARRAGVGVGTVYRHFPTKDVLVGELIRRKLTGSADLARRSLESDDGDPWESFASLLRAQAELAARDAALQRATWLASPAAFRHALPAVQDLRDAMDAVIERAKAAGAVREDLTTDDVRALFSGLGGMMAADAHGLQRCDWRRQLEFSLEGMRPAGARAGSL